MIGLYENELYPGIVDCLSELHVHGRAVFLATSKPRVFAERILDYFELRRFFSGVYGSELDGRLADKSELIGHVVRNEGLDPAGSVMVGDRRHDIAGAVRNDMPSIGVLWGFGSRDELETAGAGQICESVADLQVCLRT